MTKLSTAEDYRAWTVEQLAEKFYTVEQVAELLERDVRTVYRQIDDGRLPDFNRFKAQRRYWYDPEAVHLYRLSPEFLHRPIPPEDLAEEYRHFITICSREMTVRRLATVYGKSYKEVAHSLYKAGIIIPRRPKGTPHD